ncbi:MAG: sialidase family protein [Gemmatimonadota bacterium]
MGMIDGMDRTRRRHAVLIALIWVAGSVAGCRDQVPPETVETEQATELAVAQRVDHLDGLAREPMIVQHPDGTLFLSGYNMARPALWKSQDRGASWSRVDIGAEADGAVGNSDIDLAVGREGTVYFVTMTFDMAALEGRRIAVAASRDVGETWSWTTVSETRFDDRPWVGVAPDGTAHVIWNDGSGVAHAVSADRGASWTEQPRIHDLGGSSHLAVGPEGELAVRIVPASASGNRFDAEVDLIAVSTDEGMTWRKHEPPGERDWAPMDSIEAGRAMLRWVEPLAWDGEGRLYHLWADSTGLWLARSRDRGETWTSWPVSEDRYLSFFPYLIARGRGELAATWFSGDLDALAARREDAYLRWHVAHITTGDDEAPPSVVRSAPLSIDASTPQVVEGDTLAVPDTGGEYLGITFLRDGGVAAATPIQEFAPGGGMDFSAGRLGFTFWRFEAR